MRKEVKKMWNMVLERNERFKIALTLMNDNQIKYIEKLFNNIQECKDEKKSLEKYIDIAIRCDDYEGELYYQRMYNNTDSKKEYQVRILEEYINQVIAYES